MRVDSLSNLETAFGKWRLKKKHVRERVPEKLMKRARRAAAVHGLYAVVRAAKIEYCRLADDRTGAPSGAGRFGQRGGGGAAGRKSRQTPARRSEQPVPAARRTMTKPAAVPAYSRVEMPTRETPPRPLAEVETPLGVKLRVFSIMPETIALLSTLSGPRVTP